MQTYHAAGLAGIGLIGPVIWPLRTTSKAAIWWKFCPIYDPSRYRRRS
ncbi:hypothetical protein [Pseudomonas sp. CFII64]|nr:hypothetical protein [Pseudomonas sp. CFII64]